ncbi:unnamed protein product [Leptidea sinapis]|uniref:C2H2-type domain-containing protein n=1 Tax=Leptidea sinapis TaxID=189913 RepID=A0A5E4PZU4_9NEOP|nr:unnamed protein product [Leptidea sinapis]
MDSQQIIELDIKKEAETTDHELPVNANPKRRTNEWNEIEHNNTINNSKDAGNKNNIKTMCTKEHLVHKTITNRKKKEKTSKSIVYSCSVCTKTFRFQSVLLTHKKVHTCENTLDTHNRIHTDKKPYSCNICSKSFIRSVNLEKHYKIHGVEDERPYSCNICGKSFRRSSDLKKHTLIHTGEKPYTCNICHKRFNQSYKLKIHGRLHRTEKQYSGSESGNSCDQVGDLAPDNSKPVIV